MGEHKSFDQRTLPECFVGKQSIKNGSNGREEMNEGTLKSLTRFFHHQTLFIMQKLLCILMNTLCLPWSNKDDTEE